MAAYKDLTADQMLSIAQVIVSKNETEEQKRCEYCHEPFKHLIDIKVPIKGRKNVFVDTETHIQDNRLITTINSYGKGYYGILKKTKIENCPKCGRKL